MAAFNKWNYWTGKAVVTAHIINRYRVSPQTSSDKVYAASELFGVWGMPLTYATGGWIVTNAVKNPTSLVVMYSFLAGAYVSNVIDEEEGEDNYWGFTSGGLVGNDPNYLTGDENDSGYFNFFQNYKTLVTGTAEKNKARLNKVAEQLYIDNYFAERNWTRKLMLYDALTQEQKNLVQQKIRSGDYEGASQIL